MPKAPDNDPKIQALRQSGTLNPRPQDVRDELFREKEFFDARDLLQVRYEMLRRVCQEGHSISQAAASFGFSRPSFYQAQSAFETSGLARLVPQKRGPKEGYKLKTEILELVRKARAEAAEVRTRTWCKGSGNALEWNCIRERSSAGCCEIKKTPLNSMVIDSGTGLITQYEDLRGQAVVHPTAGMAAWARAWRDCTS
jgi:hypothetical protein